MTNPLKTSSGEFYVLSETEYKTLEEHILDGLAYDGGHHKQYYLYQASKILKLDTSELYIDEDEMSPA